MTCYIGLEESYITLLHAALDARQHAYAPYSRFHVGAAVLDEAGHIHKGCNVENAAYGPTNCAERTALFRAVADGQKAGSFEAIAIVGESEGPLTPCGVCRQVLIELCQPNMPVIMANVTGLWTISTVSELLPGAFTPKSLHKGDKLK